MTLGTKDLVERNCARNAVVLLKRSEVGTSIVIRNAVEGRAIRGFTSPSRNENMNKPTAIGFWGRIFCGLGFHKRSFAFGWTEYLDQSEPNGYAGEFFCEHCGTIL